ncbi:hypothetical protein C4D60_Mb08t02210 [Musa balbisiana]|uniref:Uncharacterized protein n=1 Tax=Musa balbisiana TaxID=52838 RepID=A0A4S8K0R0_MUSBA|nr:hypothetical protein C4D60_Mb08t02210 [Musa balbisiana]
MDALREVDWYSSPRPIRNSSPDSPSPDLTPNGAAQSSAISTTSCILWLTTSNLVAVLWALVDGLLATTPNATFQMPNLKAWLNTCCEELGAIWRNYSVLQPQRSIRSKFFKSLMFYSLLCILFRMRYCRK